MMVYQEINVEKILIIFKTCIYEIGSKTKYEYYCFCDYNIICIFIPQYDQKNVRRRVYDALNVLMAMNIISKEKKEIKWIGLPVTSFQESSTLTRERDDLMARLNEKQAFLQELIVQVCIYFHLLFILLTYWTMLIILVNYNKLVYFTLI